MKPRVTLHPNKRWWIVGSLGVVLVRPNPHVKLPFTAYRTVPVCPYLNWSETYPNKESGKFASIDAAFRWVINNPLAGGTS